MLTVYPKQAATIHTVATHPEGGGNGTVERATANPRKRLWASGCQDPELPAEAA